MLITPSQVSLQRLHFGCHDTRRNLPAASSLKRGEANFLAKFERVYLAEAMSSLAAQRQHAAGREFALNGFGRADLVFVAWKSSNSSEDFSALALEHLDLTAIEAKIKDWRKGLMQASRYRFFANQALLVLSTDAARIAVRFLKTFQALQVGLWEFDAVDLVITRHFTPDRARPLNVKAREKAVHLIESSLPQTARRGAQRN
ncbi:MAG: hypothetical protein ACO1TE_13555 [Prosthecobacter sp.]